MLRYSFLPSDYNPMVLMLGDAEDLRQLGATLRFFAASPADKPFEELDFATPDAGTRIVIRPVAKQVGMRRLSEDAPLEWYLTPDQARAYAEQLDALAAPDCKSGSEMLGPDAVNVREGIPVKVSRGEFQEKFLVTER
ncbi:hypothetical protein [Roseomonas chloroacetimidivorans]|uniref:hypothetical protein n=1 Tax=Roseomonas chloroacetimidivorans TaxID=1766656 RepID=UPI003C70D12A